MKNKLNEIDENSKIGHWVQDGNSNRQTAFRLNRKKITYLNHKQD